MHPKTHDHVRSMDWAELVSVGPNTTLRTVATVLADYEVGAAVVQPSQDLPAGIVSERDIVGALARGHDPDVTVAADVMTRELITIEPSEPIDDAIARVLAHGIRHLAVVDGDEIVGLISARDLLAIVASQAVPGII